MTRLLRPLGIVVTVTLVGYAALLLLANPGADDAVEEAIEAAQAGEDQREELEQNRERLRRTARRLAVSPEGAPDEALPVPSSVPYGSGEIDDYTARTGFSSAMRRVDDIVTSRRRLSQEEWDELYRETNDAFAALSIMLDARDDNELAELEAAHKRLKQGLGKVRVRGRKLAD